SRSGGAVEAVGLTATVTSTRPPPSRAAACAGHPQAGHDAAATGGPASTERRSPSPLAARSVVLHRVAGSSGAGALRSESAGGAAWDYPNSTVGAAPRLPSRVWREQANPPSLSPSVQVPRTPPRFVRG